MISKERKINCKFDWLEIDKFYLANEIIVNLILIIIFKSSQSYLTQFRHLNYSKGKGKIIYLI